MIALATVPIAFIAAQAAVAGSTPPSTGLAQELDDILATPAPPSQTRVVTPPPGGGLMNPEISVIADIVAGAANRPRASSAGDDPDFGGPASERTGGLALQEIEVGFQSNVDP